MSNSALEVINKINKKKKFASQYTTLEYGSMQVKEDKLFNDLSQEEKIKLSFKEDKYFCLNIWAKTWMYIDELDKWVNISEYNTYQAEYSWNPDYVVVINDEYILDIANEQLYKKV